MSQESRRFRDLNHNGTMEPYEDPELPVEDRVADLLGRMTVGEKAGLLFHAFITPGPDGSVIEPPQSRRIQPRPPAPSSASTHRTRHVPG